MDLWEGLTTRRTVRRFRQEPIPPAVLRRIVDAGRLAASGGNAQPLKFIVISRPELVAAVFEEVRWLKEAGDPPPGKRPTAYIVVLGDMTIRKAYQADAGAACQNMLLAAWGEGVGSCWIGSVNRGALREQLAIPVPLEIYAVIALGYPAERPLAVPMKESTKPWRGRDGELRVPKRSLDEILYWERYPA